MSQRRAWLDRCPGEVRGVVTLDGAPERLLIEREGDTTPRLGQRFAGRVEAVSARMGLARVDIGVAVGSLRLRGSAAPPHQGERLAVEVVAEAARGKPAALRRIEAPDADLAKPASLDRPRTVERQLADLGFADWVGGEEACERADEAQALALAALHDLGDGLTLAIEPTRALTAVDVDLADGAAGLSLSVANARALAEAARLLRLKAQGGLVAIDLIGFPKDGRRLQALAAEAFAPDGPEVVIGALSRFGVLELAKPNARRPLVERLMEPDGRSAARTVAQDLVRALERQGRFEPGARLAAVCAPEVAHELGPLVARLGPRFSVRSTVGMAREHTDIVAL